MVLTKVTFPSGNSLYPVTSQIQDYKAWALCLNLGNLWRIVQALTLQVRSSEAVTAITPQLSIFSAQVCCPHALIGVVSKAPQHTCIQISKPLFPRDPDLWWLVPEFYRAESKMRCSFLDTSRVPFELQALGASWLLWALLVKRSTSKERSHSPNSSNRPWEFRKK